MPRLALLLALATAAIGQSFWDGTKGNISIKTVGDSHRVAILITDADQSISLFSVVLSYKPPCPTIGCTPLEKTETQYASRLVSEFSSSTVMAVFSVPASQVTGVIVSEFKPAHSEMFSGDQPMPAR